jgi:hypothetical protein
VAWKEESVMDDADVVRARPFVVRFVRAVRAGDGDEIAAVYAEVAARFNVEGPQAVAVLVADMLIDQQHTTRSAIDEATRNGEAYLTWRREAERQGAKVRELRAMLEERGKDIGRLKAELNEIKTANVAA